MNDDSKIEFFEEKNKDINFKLIKKENIILFLNFFILFCFINLFLYLYLYKTTWPVPHFFSFILLNYPLLFMAWGCFLFFIHPSIILSKIVKIRYETIYIQNEKPKIRISFSAIVIFYTVVGIISIIAGLFTYGTILWIMLGVLAMIFLEFLLFWFLIYIFALFSKNLNTFLLKINIISVVLLLVIIAGLINAPALSCRTSDFKCIAGKAAEKNNPHICDKVSHPLALSDCYKFLTAANDNTCFCELVNDATEKKFCYEYSFFGGFDKYKNELKKSYSSELEKARFKDDSFVKSLNCDKNKGASIRGNTSLEYCEEGSPDEFVVRENTTKRAICYRAYVVAGDTNINQCNEFNLSPEEKEYCITGESKAELTADKCETIIDQGPKAGCYSVLIGRTGDLSYCNKLRGYEEFSKLCPKKEIQSQDINSANIKCVDSDGGKDYYIRGSASISNVTANYISPSGSRKGDVYGENANECLIPVNKNSNSIISYDCCFKTGESAQLNESYCDEKGNITSIGYKCPKGCRDGVCIK